MLNLEGNSVQQERFREQINASLPLKKQLWQQTVKIKIRNQAALLKQEHPNISVENMEYWAKSVRSGDPDNYEGRAAAYYWHYFFDDLVEGFNRGRYEADPNNMLNYGYAVLRAVTARSLTASGLLPTLGIHHRNKYNAYALADDIMEPYRPYVDKIVRRIFSMGFAGKEKPEDEFTFSNLTTEQKKELLQIPAMDVIIDGEKSPLMIAMQRTTASVYHCLVGDSRKILYPEIETC